MLYRAPTCQIVKNSLGFKSGTLSQVILIWSLMTFTSPSYGGVPFPGWGLALGWCTTAFVLLWVPAIAGYKLMRAKGNLWKVWGFLSYYKLVNYNFQMREKRIFSASLSAWRCCALQLKTGIPSWMPIEESVTPKSAAKPEETIK